MVPSGRGPAEQVRAQAALWAVHPPESDPLSGRRPNRYSCQRPRT
ncbi:hypothetical protein BN903_66 [Halorubrum sp. AJ67]|nr:hypothetical protein BN903_66 [Halorubrum sp. AJ67]